MYPLLLWKHEASTCNVDLLGSPLVLLIIWLQFLFRVQPPTYLRFNHQPRLVICVVFISKTGLQVTQLFEYTFALSCIFVLFFFFLKKNC